MLYETGKYHIMQFLNMKGYMFQLISVILGSSVLLFGLAVFNTFVLYLLWGWFLTPVFHVATPSFALLYGLMLLVSYTHPIRKEDSESGVADKIAASLAKSCVFLLVGYIVHLFV